MRGVIISYTLERANASQRTKLHQAIYGYKDHSNKGKYLYKREGLLKKSSHLKINRGVIIMLDKDKTEILRCLRRNKATIKVFNINISPSILKKT